jgi:sugar/nucleoside kinase (ribokinase family)
MARYLITGSVIVNDMRYPDGSMAKGFLGGSIYTVNGILPYTDDLLFLSAAGPDFDSLYGDYFRRNGLSEEGIEICFPKTHYTLVEYAPSGEWQEHSIYGEEFEKLYGTYPLAKAAYVIDHGGEDVRGIYFESAAAEDVWKDLEEMRKACPNAVFLAEIATSETKDPASRDRVLDLINKIDMYSINRPEAMALFGTKSEEESIEAIIALGKPCFFRLGKKGSAMIQDGKAWFAPSVESTSSVDSTGCGNCSTGASLYGYCEGLHPLKTACYANVAAGVNARQYGPFPEYTPEVKAWMKKEAEDMFERLMKNA